jgi:hypothetical protein
LIYGSIFIAVTFSPRACRQVAIDDEATPFPTPLMTPPTMKMYLGVFGVFLETLLVADLVAVFFGIFFAVAIKDIV